ncbi:hypothetical protein BBP40_006689 [Aspergillus hancockii]|nr:hypothetical protein BBP40_006689 [Aspergillus hancockii]
MKLYVEILVFLCSLVASLTPPNDHPQPATLDILIQIDRDYEDTIDPEGQTMHSRIVSRKYPRCMTYADCHGGWCHKGKCLDGACAGDKRCPDGFTCDGTNCFKYRPAWGFMLRAAV